MKNAEDMVEGSEHEGGDEREEDDVKIKEFRSQCRRFYRRSTSVMQSSSSIAGGALEEDTAVGNGASSEVIANGGGSAATSTSNTTYGGDDCRVVVEAVERLVQQSQQQVMTSDTSSSASTGPKPNANGPYSTFLSSQPTNNITVLSSCGLPTSEDDVGTYFASNPDVLARLVAIRGEERKMAHEVKMMERYDVLRKILMETSGNGLNEPAHMTKDNNDTPMFATTREDVRRIRRKLRSSVRTYCEESIASHPLLAGMRKVLTVQLGSDEETTTCAVLWKFDAAVLSEAVKTKQCGGGGDDTYMRDALDAILSFMVWIREDEEEGRSSTADQTRDDDGDNGARILSFIVDPALSDRNIGKILEVLPKEKELHGRPTGTVSIGNKERTNIDGEMDEIDFCQQIMREAFGGLKLCCQK